MLKGSVAVHCHCRHGVGQNADPAPIRFGMNDNSSLNFNIQVRDSLFRIEAH